MESSEVKTCNDQVEKYQKGIEVVIQAKADQGKRYEELKPAEVTIAELEKRPLSWLSRQKQEDEFAQAELEALQTPVVQTAPAINELDAITEKSASHERSTILRMSKLSVKEDKEAGIGDSVEFSVDLDNKA